MRRTKWLAFLAAVFLVLSLALPGCEPDETPAPTNNISPTEEFAIYLLTEESQMQVLLGQEDETDLEQLDLQEEPLISIEDIDYYDFSTHYIYLNEDFESLLERHDLQEYLKINRATFVVVAADLRRYLGLFQPPSFSSILLYDCPRLELDGDYGSSRLPPNVLWIAPALSVILSSSYPGPLDVRDDWRIKQVLEQADKLR